jgi:glycosyltransferase involved in cell wall biosynthesis
VTEALAQVLVVAFTPFPSPTGASTRLAQRLVALSNAGYAVDVLTPKTGELPHVSKYVGARIFRVPMPQHRDSLPGVTRPRPGDASAPASISQRAAAFERAVRRQLQATEYSLIYLFDPHSWPAIVASQTDTPVIYEASSDPGSTGGDPEWLATFAEREAEVLRSAAAVLVPSNEAARRATVVGASATRTHVVRPCVDTQLFQPPTDGRRRRSAPLRIAIVASTLQPQELSLLAESLLILPPSVDVHMTVSAHVNPEARSRLVSEPVLRDRLSLRDPVLYDDLAPFYQESDIGLVLSTGRNPGRAEGARLQTIAEMMSSGLATILPDLPPIREVVAHDREAFLVPPADVEALVRGIEALGSDANLCRRLGLAARNRAVEALDERKHAERLLQIVAAAIEESGRTSHQVRIDTPPEATPVSGLSRLGRSTRTATTVPGRSVPGVTARPPTRTVPSPPVEAPDEITSPELKLSLAEAAQPTQTDPAFATPV